MRQRISHGEHTRPRAHHQSSFFINFVVEGHDEFLSPAQQRDVRVCDGEGIYYRTSRTWPRNSSIPKTDTRASGQPVPVPTCPFIPNTQTRRGDIEPQTVHDVLA